MENRMKNKRKMILAFGMAFVLLATSGCGKSFDATGYVRGILDVTFQDETKQALKTMKDVTEYDLHVQHNERILRFVQNNITNEFEVSEQQQAQFENLCKKIFAVMKYQVKEAEKTGKKEYEVAISIQPSDVFSEFQKALVKDAERMAKAIEAGQYKGTEEQVSKQILDDIAYNSYDLLTIAYLDMEYEEEETVVVTVKADEKNEYYVEEEEIDNVIIKILKLDEIQD